ncbi:AEC family transporter [Corynebacterium sp. zg254]|uniref:AEC family transporter n=1 Tax=Corynebacterium zhongnanshanii TaxID=2768834 RepID=A0ABQ6VF33_9CORY|nr:MULTISPECIES: AEC family transporter [Corynebacterium]KAB3523034.1 AEC family transporter [Corynebacterium zhongnanshanii]MCR5913876.1 AEC family transporter [Corynebacterium sp. zg254]
MPNVISGFAVVIVIIALGYCVGRKQLLGPNAVYTLNMFVYWIALPPMLIMFMMDADLELLFGSGLLIAILSGCGAGLLGFLGSRFLAKRGTSDSLIAMLASSYNNSTHLGIPLAAHILGNPTATLPIILFQVGLYAPVATLALDIATQPSGSARIRGAERLRNVLGAIVRNPMIIGAVIGVTLSLLHSRYDIQLPFLITEPLDTLARATVGVALIGFGMSLAGTGVLEKGVSPRRSVLAATAIKTIIHPALAVALGHFLFGMDQHTLLILAVIAGLPTGQNVFTYAQRYQVGTILARDTAVVSTIVSVPTLCAIFFLLG